MSIRRISIYGAGSWGTALALQLARHGVEVLLWDIAKAHIQALQTERENKRYLPGIIFPDALQCTADQQALAQHSDYLLIVAPSQAMRTLLQSLAHDLTPQHAVIWASKGIEISTGKLLHQIFREEQPFPLPHAVISGPTFAMEVAKGLPTAMTVASNDTVLAQSIAKTFRSSNFRTYTSDDMVGVELGGAVKNILAIAAGISDGLGYGANARAALITRGLAEIMRLGAGLGAKQETLMGLAGLGDLVLTCTDDQSRNRRLGLALGQGKDIQQAIDDIGQAVEGYKSAHSICELAVRAGVDMPIATEVHRILYADLAPAKAVQALLTRDVKAEF